MMRMLLTAVWLLSLPAAAQWRVGTFDLDATPPRGSRLTYDEMADAGELTLRCRGVVISGGGEPVVLCAVDWIGIGNDGHGEFRRRLAEAAGTDPRRVAVHALHQHDAPICDLSAERLLREQGHEPLIYDSGFATSVMDRAAREVRAALERSRPLTAVSFGRGRVEQVASNRRLLGPDGKVEAVRFTACRDPELRARPEGVTDPEVALVGLWDGEEPLVALTYYATHPQSYYRTGVANPDFPGIARFMREQELCGLLHVHFTGAGGNIGAGKYNDGSPENRPVLARRLAEGMRRAWEGAKKFPLEGNAPRWLVEAVALPPADHLREEELVAQLDGTSHRAASILGSAQQLAWLRRCRAGEKVDLACLAIGPVRILHMPGELFVEYQLAAREMAPGVEVAMAAYGDYGPGYIGTAESYGQGGYETQPGSSFVAPEVEAVLLEAMGRLLGR